MSAVIGYGGWSVLAGTLSLGSLVAFYSFVTQLFDPLSGAAELYARAQKNFREYSATAAPSSRLPEHNREPTVRSIFRRNIGNWNLRRLSLDTDSK